MVKPIERKSAWFLVAKFCCSIVFFYSATTKLVFFEFAVAEFAALNLPFPDLIVWVTVIIQSVGALFLLTGFHLTLSCILLATFVILASVIGHPFWNYEGLEQQRQLTTFLEHVAIVGGLIALSLYDKTTEPHS